mgnify:CR=1 FL=1
MDAKEFTPLELATLCVMVTEALDGLVVDEDGATARWPTRFSRQDAQARYDALMGIAVKLDEQVDNTYEPTPEDEAYHAGHAAKVTIDDERYDDCPICFMHSFEEVK